MSDVFLCPVGIRSGQADGLFIDVYIVLMDGKEWSEDNAPSGGTKREANCEIVSFAVECWISRR